MAINDWMQGDGSDALTGGTDAYLIDDNLTAYIQDPLDLLLKEYQNGVGFDIASNTTVTVYSGQIVVSDSGGTARRFRSNAASITLDISTSGVGGLDTGSVAASTVYYVYVTADSSDTAYNGIFSTSSSFPTGVTYARKIGYVKTNSSSQITTKGTYFAQGAIAQVVFTEHQGVVTYSGGTKIPYDNTVPQSSEGYEVTELTTSIIPSKTNTTFLVETCTNIYSPTSLGQGVIAALFKDSAASAIAVNSAQFGYGGGTSNNSPRSSIVYLSHKVTISSASETTFKIRISDYQSTSTYLNRDGTTNTFGNTITSWMKITELRA